MQAGGHRFESDRLQRVWFGAGVLSGVVAAPPVCRLDPENLPVGLRGLAGLSVLFGMVNLDLVCEAFGRSAWRELGWRPGASDLRTG